jgi:galactokinase/mevalonate kinase-like predicted kinase
MERFIAGAGQAGIAFVDLDERIASVEVDVVIVAGEPAGGVVGDLVGLGREGFVLNEPSEGFCIAEVFRTIRMGSYTGSQFLLVITTGEARYLS